MDKSPFGALESRAARQQLPGQSQTGDQRFSYSRYLIRPNNWKLGDGEIFVYDPQGTTVLYATRKGFALKDQLKIYSDSTKTQMLLGIQARNFMDWSGFFDVTDGSGQKIGVLRRNAVKSMIRDRWEILNITDGPIGAIDESSMLVAVLRRLNEYLALFLPHRFTANIGGTPVAAYNQSKNPFLPKVSADFSSDISGLFDRRLGIAAAMLFTLRQGR